MRNIPLIEAIEDKGPPRCFSPNEVLSSPDLFRERAALFYTPTANIPHEWIGEGELDVTLPIASPTSFECMEVRWYETPRLWVDLLQRASCKIRWRPMNPAEVWIIRYDSIEIGYGQGIGGAKSLLDALKEKTSGRSDGHPLHYFGAIADDAAKYLKGYNFKEEVVDDPSLAKCRIVVKPARG